MRLVTFSVVLLTLASACAASIDDPNPEPGTDLAVDDPICAYLGVEILLCPSPARRMQYVSRFCEAAPSNGEGCRAVLPPDEGYTTTASGCERRVEYQLSSIHAGSDPVNGPCTEWEAFASGSIDCFNDATCEDGETCVNGTCHCGDVPITDAERLVQRCEGTRAIFSSTSCSAAGTLQTQDVQTIDCALVDRVCVFREDGTPCGGR